MPKIRYNRVGIILKTKQMGTRQTSIDCYNEIKSEGLLSRRRMQVYEAIYNSAPCTSAEAMTNILKMNGDVLSQSRARFTELREQGVIYERGIRECKLTGRKAIEWDLTDRLPMNINVLKQYKEEQKFRKWKKQGVESGFFKKLSISIL